MTLSEVKAHSVGTVKRIGGDTDMHRRLVDMGLLGSAYSVRAKRGKSVLVEFRREFSVVLSPFVSSKIEVKAIENSVMRQSERRQDNSF